MRGDVWRGQQYRVSVQASTLATDRFGITPTAGSRR